MHADRTSFAVNPGLDLHARSGFHVAPGTVIGFAVILGAVVGTGVAATTGLEVAMGVILGGALGAQLGVLVAAAHRLLSARP